MIGFAKACVAIAALTTTAAAVADKPRALELNKLEPTGKGCRIYFVVDNPTDVALQSLKLDLIFFGPDGVIARRLVVDLAPLRAAKKTVKTFDIDSPACDRIGSILLNDVLDCRSSAGPVADCLHNLTVSSRSKVPMTK